MANEYHDEQGKFCSKGEMTGLVSGLRENSLQAFIEGDYNKYDDLKKRADSLESDLLTVTLKKELAGEQKDAKTTPTKPQKKYSTFPKNGHLDSIPNPGIGWDDSEKAKAYEEKNLAFTQLNNTSYASTSEYAKAIRGDLKEAVKAGYLPSGLAYSVRKHNNTVYITAKGLNTTAVKTRVERATNPESSRFLSEKTEKAGLLLQRLENIGNKYAWDNSDPQHDYFNSNYHAYAHANTVEDDLFDEEEKVRAQGVTLINKSEKLDKQANHLKANRLRTGGSSSTPSAEEESLRTQSANFLKEAKTLNSRRKELEKTRGELYSAWRSYLRAGDRTEYDTLVSKL